MLEKIVFPSSGQTALWTTPTLWNVSTMSKLCTKYLFFCSRKTLILHYSMLLFLYLESPDRETQCRVCCVIPPPQLLEQGDQELHADQTPLGFGCFFANCDLNKWWTCNNKKYKHFRSSQQKYIVNVLFYLVRLILKDFRTLGNKQQK